MSETSPERRARAERLRGYFALQLVLADRIAERLSLSLGDAALQFTNLHRRFGLGRPGHAPHSADWERYADRLERLQSADARVEWTVEFFAGAREEPSPQPEIQFGCFSFEPPDPAGMVRIHFYNRDCADGLGPLARQKAPARTAELARMFAFIQDTYPSARTVRGGSWLYNIEAYRRLFPPAYTESRTEPAAVRLNGTSSWGQFLDSQGSVKAQLAQAFMRNLEGLDAHAPWRVFPLRPLLTHAAIDVFYEFYEGRTSPH